MKYDDTDKENITNQELETKLIHMYHSIMESLLYILSYVYISTQNTLFIVRVKISEYIIMCKVPILKIYNLSSIELFGYCLLFSYEYFFHSHFYFLN